MICADAGCKMSITLQQSRPKLNTKTRGNEHAQLNIQYRCQCMNVSYRPNTQFPTKETELVGGRKKQSGTPQHW